MKLKNVEFKARVRKIATDTSLTTKISTEKKMLFSLALAFVSKCGVGTLHGCSFFGPKFKQKVACPKGKKMTLKDEWSR